MTTITDYRLPTTDYFEMYHRPRFLEELEAIREEMSRECDYDMDLFAELIRSNELPTHGRARNIRGVRQYAPPNPAVFQNQSRREKKNDPR